MHTFTNKLTVKYQEIIDSFKSKCKVIPDDGVPFPKRYTINRN